MDFYGIIQELESVYNVTSTYLVFFKLPRIKT